MDIEQLTAKEIGINLRYLRERKKLSVKEQIADFVAGPGIIQGADYLRDNPAFYLVERGNRQFLVKVTKDFITTSDLAEKVSPSKFVLGSYKFKKAYQLK